MILGKRFKLPGNPLAFYWSAGKLFVEDSGGTILQPWNVRVACVGDCAQLEDAEHVARAWVGRGFPSKG